MEAMSRSDKGVDVEGIGKSFGSVDALRDISFDVGRAARVVILPDRRVVDHHPSRAG